VERLLSEPQHGVPVRVILVGKTGLDAKLRLDASAEVIRVRSPMEAIGELGSPTEAAVHSVVIVGDEAGSVSTNPEVASDFARGVRVIDEDITVLRVGAVNEGGAFDGLVPSDVSTTVLRELLRKPRGRIAETAAAPSRPMTPPRPKTAEDVRPSNDPLMVEIPSGHTPEMGDEDVIKALVRGQDILPAALAVLRRRLGDPTLSFDASPEAGGKAVATVAWDATVYGVLTSKPSHGPKLARAAEWLASWMRLAEQQNALRNAAFTDPLTGAFNRRYFDKFLASAIESAREERRSVTVLAFDIDDFKTYNDRFGHATGDEILREVVKLLQSVVRPTDRVCRIGGDEFAVIFYEPKGPRESGSRHPQSIHAIADRFQSQIRGHKFPRLQEAPGPLTVSGGLATYPWDGATAADLLAKADQLALESKRQGKNVITIGG
jgi:diguanylate cyclase (GGDEF)-like protein